MSDIDKKIAKLKLQERAEKNRIEKENHQENETELLIDLQEVINQIDQGLLEIDDKKYRFERKSFLNGNMEIPIPIGVFKEQVNTDINVELVNELKGVSFSGTYIDKGAKKQTFAQFKSGMDKGFKEMRIYAEWIEEGIVGENINDIYYATYKTPTAKGELYNLIFYRQYKGSMLIGNYNCFYKDIKAWEFIIKGSINLIKVK